MFLLKLIFRNTLRHKLRSFLTLVGVAVAILAFGLLRTFIGAWHQGVEAASATRLVTRNAISLVFPLPLSYGDRIRRQPGIEGVAHANWFGGIYIDRKNFFPNFAIAAEDYLALYPEFVLEPDEKSAFFRDRRGAVAGANLAATFGWKIGDPITLQGTIYPGNWELVLRGIYRGGRPDTDQSLFFFHWDYLNETVKKFAPLRSGKVGHYIVGIERPDLAAEAASGIDRLFSNSLAETLTETEAAFMLSFVTLSGALITAIRIVSYVVILIIMVVAANTMAMAARERIGEYATMKSLGFGARHIALAVFGESLLIALSGGAAGLLLTYPAAEVIGEILKQFFPVFRVPPETVWLGLAAAVTVGTVAGIFPAWRGATIRIAEGLRRIG